MNSLRIIQSEIITLRVNAIVNATNSILLGGGKDETTDKPLSEALLVSFDVEITEILENSLSQFQEGSR